MQRKRIDKIVKTHMDQIATAIQKSGIQSYVEVHLFAVLLTKPTADTMQAEIALGLSLSDPDGASIANAKVRHYGMTESVKAFLRGGSESVH